MKLNKINILLGVIIILNLGLATTFYFVQQHIDAQTADCQRKTKVIQRNRSKRQNVMLNNIEPKNLERYRNEVNAEAYARKLYQILFNFDNSKEYNSRSRKAKEIVSSNVFEDKKLFGTDKDSSGGSYVDSLQLRSRLYDIESYIGIKEKSGVIKVTSIITQAASRSGVSEGKQRFVYQSIFDPRKKVFTEVSKVGMVDETVE
ncbi:hypothetical protein [Ligilactobacillus faecis]|uniref:hypothetical protein n=1 Tax=Ligilactobacillus faecis TaxID=762833 RepID=UPI0024697161|nr:hypothetical protein [Ligilactobacillus faecis]WGN89536.1 hypothetical protein QFX10_00050 [Ligilactobacillus faecis]